MLTAITVSIMNMVDSRFIQKIEKLLVDYLATILNNNTLEVGIYTLTSQVVCLAIGC